ncbi:hypothetical protein GIB67_029132 [Kingdonia uniflora]|uniref:Cytochrome P450 n=1 Tax=Kingdonia uniflora TaxID=39325 RepID=A0A7J7N463_9MAGN|nr:hypothetical protein GIB67_029132 [Kingdonia uniflora]
MTVRRIVGDCTLTGLSKPRYKLVKGAMMSFLKPESLRSYVSHLDEIVHAHIVSEIKEKESINAVDFMKKLTFDVTFTILFGIDGKSPKEAMFHDFDQIFKAVWFVPLNFPVSCHYAKSIISFILEQMEIFLRKRRNGEEKLTWTDLQSMKYTWRVAQELMKIIPLVFENFREAAKDLYNGGYFIPKGWKVFWVSHGTQMNENIFENPKVFDPSRFKNPSKPIFPYVYVPFGGGPHMCSGNDFARVEILTIIHRMVTKFEWSQGDSR